MMNNITLVKDFDIAKLSYNDVRLLDNGGKVVYVSYNKAPLILQTPMMYAPFGVQKWTNDGRDKYTLSLSFRGKDTSKSMQSFYDMLHAVDTKLVEDGFSNQSTWFKGKKYNSKEVLEALYTPLITPAKDKNTGDVTDKYPATFKMTVPTKDNEFTCEVYDDKQNQVDLLSMNTKGARVSALIQFSGLWFAGGKFGSSWRVVQLLVKPNQNIKGFAFKMNDPDDTLAEAPAEDVSVNHDPKEILEDAIGSHDNDTHDEDEGEHEEATHVNTEDSDDDDDELEQPVQKKTVKKVTMRKK
jgi:hypothetical protein